MLSWLNPFLGFFHVELLFIASSNFLSSYLWRSFWIIWFAFLLVSRNRISFAGSARLSTNSFSRSLMTSFVSCVIILSCGFLNLNGSAADEMQFLIASYFTCRAKISRLTRMQSLLRRLSNIQRLLQEERHHASDNCWNIEVSILPEMWQVPW